MNLGRPLRSSPKKQKAGMAAEENGSGMQITLAKVSDSLQPPIVDTSTDVTETTLIDSTEHETSVSGGTSVRVDGTQNASSKANMKVAINAKANSVGVDGTQNASRKPNMKVAINAKANSVRVDGTQNASSNAKTNMKDRMRNLLMGERLMIQRLFPPKDSTFCDNQNSINICKYKIRLTTGYKNARLDISARKIYA